MSLVMILFFVFHFRYSVYKTLIFYCYFIRMLTSFLTPYDISNHTLFFLCSPKNFGGAYIVVALSVRLSIRTSHLCPAHNFVI